MTGLSGEEPGQCLAGQSSSEGGWLASLAGTAARAPPAATATRTPGAGPCWLTGGAGHLLLPAGSCLTWVQPWDTTC